MIKIKKCSLCDKPAFSKGFCQKHSSKSIIKSKGVIKQKSGRKEDSKKEKQGRRSIYFEYHIERCTHSEFSKTIISNPTRSNIAHLIDKGRHPSLEDNLDNYVYLQTSEHERFDKLLFSLEFDKIEKEFKNILDLIRIRYIKLIPLCKESTNFTRELEKWIQNLK